jgi:hypothetical protein
MIPAVDNNWFKKPLGHTVEEYLEQGPLNLDSTDTIEYPIRQFLTAYYIP